jgi:hypothetical protein
MSKTNQSLIKIYLNNNDEIVIAYGDSESCSYQELEISCLVVNKKDLAHLADALLSYVEEDK